MRTTQKPVRIFEKSPAHTAFKVVLFVFVLALVVLEYPGLSERLRAPEAGIQTRNLTIQRIDADSPNAGGALRPGDEIYAVDGHRLRNNLHYARLVAENVSLAPQTYTVLRNGKLVDVRVSYVPQAAPAMREFAFLLVAFVFLLVGIWVYLRRPDLLGALFVSNCTALAFLLTHRPSTPSPSLQIAGELIYDLIILLFPAVLFHFFHVFPGRHGGRRIRWRTRITTLYAIPLVIYVFDAVVAVRRFMFQPVPETLVNVILAVSTTYFMVYVIGSLYLFLRGYRYSNSAQKLKLRVVIAGTLAALLPVLIATVLRSVSPGARTGFESAAMACVVFLPITFAYAILKHGAIELNLVVRRSLVYAFLTGAVIAGYYALIQLISDLMVKQLGLSEYVWMPLGILVLAIVFAPARERIQSFVDRLFYRTEYTYKQEVVDFNRQLARKLTRDEILACFLDKSRKLLNPSFVAVYTKEADAGFAVEASFGDTASLPELFPRECFLGRYFSRFKTPLMVEYLDRSWERRSMDVESRQFIAAPGVSVCLPLVTPDSFLGVVLLGERMSETVYRRADADLLAAFAERLGLVLQNADLLMDSLHKERLESEVMLARDIQLSLLPKVTPNAPGIDIIGTMVSSFEVAGDYFDYFPIDDRRTGLAIGDVSGKGVPAAMLMASLRAVFKNLAQKRKLGPAELNRELNDFVYENAKPDQFATFFYGVIDNASSVFTFSNAGQCPALLLKEGYTDRLGEGGLVLGVRPSQEYQEGSVSLDPGDLLVLYTDGITEQTEDGSDEEYGEHRLIEFLHLHKNLPVARLQEALLADVVSFGGGRQDDDITSVIASRQIA